MAACLGRTEGKSVKMVKNFALTTVTSLIMMQQALAQDTGGPGPTDPGGGVVVPEMDGSGAILAIGLVVGLVALFRERFR